MSVIEIAAIIVAREITVIQIVIVTEIVIIIVSIERMVSRNRSNGNKNHGINNLV